jgi:hypothetical protein
MAGADAVAIRRFAAPDEDGVIALWNEVAQ